MDNDLSLREHLDLLGISGDHLAFCASVPKEVIQRALAGKPITRPHAQSIADQLSEQHGMKHQVGFAPEDIGLQIYEPPAKNSAEKPNFYAARLQAK